MRLVGYVRVSTDEQARNGSGLAAQEHAIRQWCELMGHELVVMYRDEGVSASSLDRSALGKALLLMGPLPSPIADGLPGANADGLIVVKLDRLTRSVRDFCDLIERFDKAGKALVSVRDNLDTASASGRLVANIMVSVAQWERETISERTREGLAQRRREGVVLGRPVVPLADGVEASIRERARLVPLRANAVEHGVSVSVVRRVLRNA